MTATYLNILKITAEKIVT